MEMELHQPVRITRRNLTIILIEIRNTRAFRTQYVYPSTRSQNTVNAVLRNSLSFNRSFNVARYFV
jgi:hypothetical protein